MLSKRILPSKPYTLAVRNPKYCLFLFCIFPIFVLLENRIGDAGAQYLAEALQANQTLTHLYLFGMIFNFSFLF